MNEGTYEQMLSGNNTPALPGEFFGFAGGANRNFTGAAGAVGIAVLGYRLLWAGDDPTAWDVLGAAITGGAIWNYVH